MGIPPMVVRIFTRYYSLFRSTEINDWLDDYSHCNYCHTMGLIKKIHGISFSYYFQIAIFWTLMAILLDYLLLVRVLKPEDAYYKADVYLYYALTFILPLLVGVWKRKKPDHASTRQPNQS